MIHCYLLVPVLLASLSCIAHGHAVHGIHGVGVLADWVFWPDNSLGQRAANHPGPAVLQPRPNLGVFDTLSLPILLHGEEPTERWRRMLPDEKLPRGAFTLEFWTLNHVNQPVGVLAGLRGQDPRSAAWLLAQYNDKIDFELSTDPQAPPVRLEVTLPRNRGFKKYFHHVVATFDGSHARLFINGELRAQAAIEGTPAVSEDAELELAAYMNREPTMQLGHFLKAARLHDEPLTDEQIAARFAELKGQVEQGILYPGIFHFTAGPQLNLPGVSSMNLIWETDRPAEAEIGYGTTAELDQSMRIQEPRRIQQVTLPGLEPETRYYYRITAIGDDDERIDSGLLTFKTAPATAEAAFSFAVVGDPEARPHINQAIARRIWDARPDFLLNCGDLTDGGREDHKFEWNYEYFQGLTPLLSRVPSVPVPGNGEGDLYWYRRFHHLPQPEGYYKLSYANGDFFLLDSNRRKTDFQPGGEQYEWLKTQLAASQAVWKFVAHHHPTYTSDEDDYGDTWKGESDLGDLHVRPMVRLYEEYDVDLVFFGHLHTFERSWPIRAGRVDQQSGVRYIQAGGMGGNLEDFAPTRSWFTRSTFRGHHYCTIDVQGRTLSFRMFDLSGALKDTFTIRK